MKKERMSERDRKALFALGIIIVVALAYFLGFHIFLEEAKVITMENMELETRLYELQMKDRGKQIKIEETEAYLKKIDAIVAKYPSKITTEKIIYDLDAIQSNLGKLQYNNVILEMNTLFYPEVSTASTTETEGEITKESANAAIKVYKSRITTNVKNLSYTALKTLIDEVNQYDGRLTVESMNIMFSKETGLLEGEIIFNFYTLENSEKEYKVPDISGISAGLKNIFGTFEKKLKAKE